jgi:2',3'-cyclic-nucleotide 2'-phosphodiesterase (5'-nucleotidase family)
MTCVIEATGQQVLDALEMASRNFPEECGGFLQVSGITYTIDTSVPSSVVTDVKGSFVKVSGKYRVCDVMVGGIPLDLTKTYTVASHNYMLRNSGDGMSMFEGCPVVKDDIEVDADTLMNYISGLGGNIGADYSDPKGQGRINTK